jgi:hypothetical protein
LTCPNPAFPPLDIAARLALESAWPEALFNAESAAVALLFAITSLMPSTFRIHFFFAPDSLPSSERSMYWTTPCIYSVPLKLAFTSKTGQVFLLLYRAVSACNYKLNYRLTPAIHHKGRSQTLRIVVISKQTYVVVWMCAMASLKLFKNHIY